ncbi:C6 transcription factor domain-containing protein [Paecilomyces variotii No. 5]|uniref:C6 transcription factor domain-containing protein n=1 Tax=Byssochlamys spectabilis (strain No. 5 / NBRC 109023) TaxID=1356009 RepID=V5F798_BYSSN|nr:C6 transcription factor domain-containing protein [Paecilomyces variotii No. 5]
MRLGEDAMERLARYERILRRHGLLEADIPLSVGEKRQGPISFHWNEPEASKAGTLLAEEEQSRYISGNPWSNLEDEEMRRVFDEEEQGYEELTSLPEKLAPDPLTGVFMGSQYALTQLHPTHAEAMILWETYVKNVEPLCKILHIPSTAKIVSIASQPEMASKADVCLLFSIYHFAVFSVTDEECAHKLGRSRATLMQRYHLGARHALVNAAFLKTSSIGVLQALILFLLSCRYYYDSHTYWILTGIAVRIGQRMGLHWDGKRLGLPPFDVQIRRRLFLQSCGARTTCNE